MEYRTVKAKVKAVIDVLQEKKSQSFDACPTIEIGSNDIGFDGLTPSDIENVLRLLDGQENCIMYSSKKRYQTASDCKRCREYQELHDLLYIVPAGRENEVRQQLSNMLNCLDFKVTLLGDFAKGAEKVVKNVHISGKNAVRLYFDDMDRPFVEVCDTGLAACVCGKIRGEVPLAFIQRIKTGDSNPFSINELTEKPNHYGNGTLLRRVFGEAYVYKPFCSFNGDYGKVSVSHYATYQRLENVGVKLKQIEDFLRRKKYNLE